MPASRRETATDRPPVPPQKPLALDCCESGCDRCVFEIYADDLGHYQSLLAAWRVRNPGCDPDAA
jgi:hypothetical protein